ncbi:hypothetical protein Dimus_018589 [Dionaea muscipula]
MVETEKVTKLERKSMRIVEIPQGSQLKDASRVFVKHPGNAVQGERLVLLSRVVKGVRGLDPSSLKSRLAPVERKPCSGKRRTMKAWRRKVIYAEVLADEEPTTGAHRRWMSEVGSRRASRGKKSVDDKLPIAEHGVWGSVTGGYLARTGGVYHGHLGLLEKIQS